MSQMVMVTFQVRADALGGAHIPRMGLSEGSQSMILIKDGTIYTCMYRCIDVCIYIFPLKIVLKTDRGLTLTGEGSTSPLWPQVKIPGVVT